MSGTFRGLALESSGPRLAVGVFDRDGQLLAERARASEQSHARHLLAVIEETLAAASLAPRDVDGLAVDVGPGSFTALRVGLATARGLAHPFGTPVVGVTSLAALVEGLRAPQRLVVPLLVAGKTQLYAGFYRGDPRGELSILRGPAAGTVKDLLRAVDEALELCSRGCEPRFLGPGAARERQALEARHPGSTAGDGADGVPVGAAGPEVAAVARLGARLLAAGNPAERLRPLYVRAPQAVERAPAVRPFWSELSPAPLTPADLDEVLVIENAVFTDPWPRQFFLEEISLPQSLARLVRLRGKVVGYLLAWSLEDEMHLGNLAVASEVQRRGVGQYLLEWLLGEARALGKRRISLEVRASNFAAQELYRRHDFRAVALRRGYYHDTGEDALVMLHELE